MENFMRSKYLQGYIIPPLFMVPRQPRLTVCLFICLFWEARDGHEMSSLIVLDLTFIRQTLPLNLEFPSDHQRKKTNLNFKS